MSKNITKNAENALIFTDAAAEKVYTLIVEDNNPTLNLRVFITGGGCSGFQYGFTFDDEIHNDDIVVQKTISTDGKNTIVKLLVDAMSFQYLKNAEID